MKCDGQTRQSTTEPEYSYTAHTVVTNVYDSVQSIEDAWLLWIYGNTEKLSIIVKNMALSSVFIVQR